MGKTPIDKLFEAVDYYKKWREKLVWDTAIRYLREKNPNHPLLKITLFTQNYPLLKNGKRCLRRKLRKSIRKMG